LAHHGGRIRQITDDLKIDRGIQPADKIAALPGLIMINNDDFYIFHIKTQGVAEKQNQQQRNNKGQVKTAEVADEVKIFFAGNGLNVFELHGVFRAINLTNASFKSACG